MKTCPNCRAIYPDNFAICPQDATPLIEAEGWSEGSVVRGKYRILGKIGQGGMGAVYKALHLKFDQLRALKVMSRELAADPDFVKRFEREAVLMSRLQHANVVRVDDIDETEDGRPYIVMEYIEGRSLRQVIQDEGPLPPLRVCSIARQAAAGLSAAHLLGMVHRDVKPDNIVLLDTSGGETAKVLDFGIAKLKEAKWGDGIHTATGVIVGTPQYLSPEQAMGMRSEDLDGRSDLYSLGLVMYQMLTQKLPFHADSAVGWLMAHVQVKPIPICVARPDSAFPETLISLVMQCLEKDRESRPPNAQELIRGIERVEDEIPQLPKKATQVGAPPFPSDTLPVPIVAPVIVAPSPDPAPGLEPSPRAVSTSHWARGWKFWVGLAVVALIPLALGPLYDLTPFTDGHGSLESFAAVLGVIGWCMVTRRHWGWRAASLIPLALFGVLLTARVSNIYHLLPRRYGGGAPGLPTIDELIRSGQDPFTVSPLTPGVDSATGRPLFNFTIYNGTSDARVTNWYSDTVTFDKEGRMIRDDSSTIDQPTILVDPGEASQQVLMCDPIAARAKVILGKVKYQLLTSGGKQRGSAVWDNPHFQADLAKALHR